MRSWIFSLLFFSLPFQTRTLVFQGQNEYQSIFLYGTDILLGLALFATFLTGRTRWQLANYKRELLPLSLFIGWVTLSSIFSENISLGLWKAIKLLEFVSLFFLVLSFKEASYYNALRALFLGGVFQSSIAVWQFLSQHDLGLRILGENQLAPNLAGVAKLDLWAGEKLIRAYGTFPHPNVLATFLLLCIFIALYLWVKEKKGSWWHHIALITLPFFIMALFLTFSRAVIGVSVVALVLWFVSGRYYKQSLSLPLTVILSSFLVFTFLLFPFLQLRTKHIFQEQELSFRLLYTQHAFQAIREHPILGVGPGQFTSYQETQLTKFSLPVWVNQPVHNIYLLFASEAGIPALFFFFWFLIEVMRTSTKGKRYWKLEIRNWIFPITLLAIGLTDHFFLTFQQGSLIFWLSLAISYQYSILTKNSVDNFSSYGNPFFSRKKH